MRGAVEAYLTGSPYPRYSRQAADLLERTNVPSLHNSHIGWNDTPNRTKQQVIAARLTAAQAARVREEAEAAKQSSQE